MPEVVESEPRRPWRSCRPCATGAQRCSDAAVVLPWPRRASESCPRQVGAARCARTTARAARRRGTRPAHCRTWARGFDRADTCPLDLTSLIQGSAQEVNVTNLHTSGFAEPESSERGCHDLPTNSTVGRAMAASRRRSRGSLTPSLGSTAIARSRTAARRTERTLLTRVLIVRGGFFRACPRRRSTGGGPRRKR